MKHLITIISFLLGVSLQGQTTEAEYNYAKKGFRVLQEIGMPVSDEYSFIPTDVYTPAESWDSKEYVWEKMIRSDGSLALVVVWATPHQSSSENPYACMIIVHPASESSIQRMASQPSCVVASALTGIDNHTMVIRLAQKAFWPEYVYPDYEPDNSEEYSEATSNSQDSYQLGNRATTERPKPRYDCNGEGVVVVKVYVNRYGKTVRVEGGQAGSTAPQCLIDRAEVAAMKTKWEGDPGAPELQVGQITYRFKVN